MLRSVDGDTPILATAVQHCRALVYLLVHRTPSSLGQSNKLAAEVGDVVHDVAPDRVGSSRPCLARELIHQCIPVCSHDRWIRYRRGSLALNH
jgi:hypothetical protein